MSSRFLNYFNSSIFKKNTMAITGLLLCGFLVTHLAGNLLIFVGPQTFNSYSHTLISNPFIIPAEIILALIFLSHIFMAIRLTIENKLARPTNYYSKVPTGRGATFASSTMPITGFIILAFLIWHILKIKFGPEYSVTYDGVVMRDFYRLLTHFFQNKLHVIGYILSVAALGVHLSHGFWSAFQSLGFNHPKYNCCIKCAAKVFAVIIFIGYSALPLYFYYKGGQ